MSLVQDGMTVLLLCSGRGCGIGCDGGSWSWDG